MSNDTGTPAGRWRKGRLLVIASLALNLVFIGLVAGAFFAGSDKHRGDARYLERVSMGLGRYIDALPEPERGAVLEAAGGISKKARHARYGQFRQIRKELRAALERPDLTEPELRAILLRQRDSALSGTIAVQEAFALAFAGLDPQERKAVIDRAEERRRTWRKGFDAGHRDDR